MGVTLVCGIDEFLPFAELFEYLLGCIDARQFLVHFVINLNLKKKCSSHFERRFLNYANHKNGFFVLKISNSRGDSFELTPKKKKDFPRSFELEGWPNRQFFSPIMESAESPFDETRKGRLSGTAAPGATDPSYATVSDHIAVKTQILSSIVFGYAHCSIRHSAPVKSSLPPKICKN